MSLVMDQRSYYGGFLKENTSANASTLQGQLTAYCTADWRLALLAAIESGASN